MTRTRTLSGLLGILVVVVGVMFYQRSAPVAAKAAEVATTGTLEQAQSDAINPKPDAKFACSCSGGGITQGMAIVHCICGTGATALNCIAVRSTATPGEVATSCK